MVHLNGKLYFNLVIMKIVCKNMVRMMNLMANVQGGFHARDLHAILCDKTWLSTAQHSTYLHCFKKFQCHLCRMVLNSSITSIIDQLQFINST